MPRRTVYWAPALIFLCAGLVASIAAAETPPAPAQPPAPTLAPEPSTLDKNPSAPAATAAPAASAEEDDEAAAPAPIDPPIQLGPPTGYGMPATTGGLRLSTPGTHGLKVASTTLHPYAGLRLETRSNVFYKSTRVDADSLEALDLGLHGSVTNAAPAAVTTQLTADYQARFELFNRFSELNYIQQHAFVDAELRTPELGAELIDHIGTAHDPDTVELATLVNRELRRFYHHGELSLFQPRSDDLTAGRFAIAATVDNARYEGTALNFAETDRYGVHLTWSQPQSWLPWAADPLIFKLSVLGDDHPTPVLNNFVMYQAVVKLSGMLGDNLGGATTSGGSGAPALWDYELVLGLAAIDVQTFHAGQQKRNDTVLPVAAFQLDGDLNSKQFLHFRFNALHEADVSLTSNYLRRTRLAATLSQRLGEAYTWELAAAEEWVDPSRGPALAQFTLRGELRWTKELPNRYLGPHAPVFFRVETRNVSTVERNRTGVHTWDDTRLTLGWAIAL